MAQDRESPTVVWEVVGLMVLVIALVLWMKHYSPENKQERAQNKVQEVQKNEPVSKVVNVEE